MFRSILFLMLLVMVAILYALWMSGINLFVSLSVFAFCDTGAFILAVLVIVIHTWFFGLSRITYISKKGR